VKTDGIIVKRYLALLLSTAYLFISLSYIFFLPQYNLHIIANKANGKAVASRISFHRAQFNKGVANSNVLFHRIYKSIAENKRKAAIFLLAAATFIIPIIFSGIDLPGSVKKMGNRLRFSQGPSQFLYLSFCTLRI
jgi:hypothetical protein